MNTIRKAKRIVLTATVATSATGAIALGILGMPDSEGGHRGGYYMDYDPPNCTTGKANHLD